LSAPLTTTTMSPRPILKQTQSKPQPHPHGVHFPPSPSLTRTFTAHSAAAYDRSPIVVAQNSCALPERGCPGRTYLLEETTACYPRGIAYARDYHPRALAFASATHAGISSSSVPQLIPDMYSESDESDGFSSVPAESTYCPTNTNAKQHGCYPNPPNLLYSSNTAYTPIDDDLAPSINTYLPYPPPSPTSPTSSSGYHWDAHPDGSHHSQKPRRKKDGRRHESSSDPDRIPSRVAVDVAAVAYGMGNLSISPPSPIGYSSSGSPTMPSSPQRKKGVRRHQPTSSFVGGGFGTHDDGCLGGF